MNVLLMISFPTLKDKFGGWFDALVTDDTNCHATIDDLEARVRTEKDNQLDLVVMNISLGTGTQRRQMVSVQSHRRQQGR